MCTTIIVGEKASANGSFLLARSADSSALKAQHFVIHEAAQHPSGSMYRTKDHHGATAFEYPYPFETLRYTTVPNWQTGLHGAAGFNSEGVGLSGTESIFARDDALAFDPYNTESGITEDDIADVLLMQARTAREACALLGRIIEDKGCGEGFGVGFIDDHDSWYLETGTGHQWMAQRTPADSYFASANQGRLREYDPKRDDQMSSPSLMEFARKNGLWNPEKDGSFDFSRAYTRDDGRDRIYNDPRVWIMQKRFNPSLKQDPAAGRSFPLYLQPERKITLEDLKAVMRDHYEGTEHDPYDPGLRGEEPWRPISVFRTYEAHVLQVRPWLPRAIGCVQHMAFGMADLSVFVPYYQGLKAVPLHYRLGTDHADSLSVYWKYRKLQALVMTDYTKLAPAVKAAFRDFEKTTAIRQAAMEEDYLKLAKVNPKRADDLLNNFNLRILAEAEELAERLLNEAFTTLTGEIQEKVFFRNNKNKD